MSHALVVPFYLSLLHGNLMREKSGDLPARLKDAAHRVSDDELTALLAEREWRGRLTAAWFVGLSNRTRFVPLIGSLLLASETVYAGQGYCVALGLVGGRDSEVHLRAYLEKYLPPRGSFYDQEWAIGALTHLMGRLPDEFLAPTLWAEAGGELCPDEGIRGFANLVTYLRANHLVAG